MKKILVLLPIFFFLCIHFLFAQTPNKPKHLLPNGEPDRPFTFFVKHGFAAYNDAVTRNQLGGKPAYFAGIGTRIEDDDHNSPVFFELEGLIHNANKIDTATKSLTTLRVNLNFDFVILNNASKSFRWNGLTGIGWNSIYATSIPQTSASVPSKERSKQFGFNFGTQAEMMLKHKRFSLFANYHVLPFLPVGLEQYNFNTLSFGAGFYFR